MPPHLGAASFTAAIALRNMYDKADGGSGSSGTGGRTDGPELPPTGDLESGNARTFDADGGREEGNTLPADEETVAHENQEGYNKGKDKLSAGVSPKRANDELSKRLTRAQQRNINTLNNVYENNLTEGDFSGTLADLQGTPIPRENGEFYDHLTEMRQSYRALQKIQKALQNSLRNPNLDPEI